MWSQTARPLTTAASSDTDVILESSTGVHHVERHRGRSCGHRQTWTPVPNSFPGRDNRVYGREDEKWPTGFVAGDKLRFREIRTAPWAAGPELRTCQRRGDGIEQSQPTVRSRRTPCHSYPRSTGRPVRRWE